MKRPSHRVGVACGVFLLHLVPAGSLHAQPPSDGQPPVFRSGVDLVRLDVRVTGANGLPVVALRQSEIVVTEDGRERPVLLFQHVEEPRGRTYAQAAQRTIASEVSTNRGAPRGHLYVLVFDAHHITPGNEMRARSAAKTLLGARLRPEDRVAIYTLPGPGAALAFSGDVRKAIGALDHVYGGMTRVGQGALGSMSTYEAYEIARGNEFMMSRLVGGYSTSMARSEAASDVARANGDDPRVFRQLVLEDARRIVARSDEDARQFLIRLAELLHTLTTYEGRKTVLLFSEGFFTDHVTRELDEVAAAAAQSYSVVYALDLNSRMNDPSIGAPVGADQFHEIQNRLEPLGALALATDGALIADANHDMLRALAQVATGSQDYYIVGFEASAAARSDPNAYRRIQVKTTRPGAKASARTGYSLATGVRRDRRTAINAALSAPYPLQAIPVEYTTYVVGSDTAGMAQIVLSLSAQLPVASKQRTTADVVFAVRRIDDGRLVASGTDTIPLPRAAAAGQTVGVAKYRVQFTAAPGDCLMRVVVRDPDGVVGTADRKFAVRALGSAGLSASDLILNSKSGDPLPVHAVAYTEGELTGALELYARGALPVDGATVTVNLSPVGAGRSTSTLVASLGPLKTRPGGVARSAEVALPVAGLAPGEYVAMARVKDTAGETIAELQRDVEIVAGPPPLPQASANPQADDVRNVLQGEIANRYRAASPSAAGLRGLACFEQADYVCAAASLAEARDAEPRSADVAFLLGWAERAADRPVNAITAWRGAAYLDPSLVPAHLALADLYLELSQPALAVQALRAGLTAVPHSRELADSLARLEGK